MSAIHKLLTDHIDIWTAADTEKKSGRGRSSGNAASVYGIKKLRELILGLGLSGALCDIRGEFDRPVHEILSSIRKKYAAATGRKLKEYRAGPSVINEFTIPENWVWARVSDLCDLQTGATPSTQKQEYYGGNIRWLSSGDINQGVIEDCAGRITELGLSSSNCKILPPKTVLIALNGQGKTRGTVALLNVEAACNQSLVGMIPFDPTYLVAEFLLIALQYRYYEIRDITGQNQRRGLNMGLVSELSVPFPPVAVQRRIVAKVDELMALCDQLEAQHNNAAEAHEKLVSHLLGTLTESQSAEDFSDNWQRIAEHFDTMFTTEASIDDLKQTLLQLAVMGKLVPQDPEDEPASELVKHIQIENRKLKAAGLIRERKVLPVVTDQEKEFELPQGWAWVRLGELGDWGAGATPLRSNSCYFGGSIPWFKSGELSADYIDTSEETVTELALKECSLRLNQPGDVLLAMYGATIGKSAILKVAATTNQAVCACTPSTGVYNEYLLVLLRAMKFKFIEQGAGGAQPNISREKIVVTSAALPPTDEQHRIVAQVEKLVGLCNQLKLSLAIASKQRRELASLLANIAIT